LLILELLWDIFGINPNGMKSGFRFGMRTPRDHCNFCPRHFHFEFREINHFIQPLLRGELHQETRMSFCGFPHLTPQKMKTKIIFKIFSRNQTI
jgi:hypothetical protein